MSGEVGVTGDLDALFGARHALREKVPIRKLETMVEGRGLKPGMRLLDIGGGWGAVTRYCGARGVHVTTLTIAEEPAAGPGNQPPTTRLHTGVTHIMASYSQPCPRSVTPLIVRRITLDTTIAGVKDETA